MTKLYLKWYNSLVIRNDFVRHMGIDFGDKRIGIAFSDLSATLSSRYEVYVCKGYEQDIQYLSDLAKSMQVKKVVFGLPLNADGTESEQTLKTKSFARDFSLYSQIDIDFEDERFSSLEADEILKQSKLNWKERKKILDKVSAEIILQNYLNKIKRG